jgi:hypothetical protein
MNIDSEYNRSSEGMPLFKRGDTDLTGSSFEGKYYPVGDLGEVRLVGTRGNTFEYEDEVGLYVVNENWARMQQAQVLAKLGLFHLGLHLKSPIKKAGCEVVVKMVAPYTGSQRFITLDGRFDEDGSLSELSLFGHEWAFFVSEDPEYLENLRFRFSAHFKNTEPHEI